MSDLEEYLDVRSVKSLISIESILERMERRRAMLQDLDGEHQMSVEVSGTSVWIVCKVDGKPIVTAKLDPSAALNVASSLIDAVNQITNDSVL